MSSVLSLALLGHPVKHSVSAPVHTAALHHHGLAGRYELWDVSPAELAEAVRHLRSQSYAGANFTIPHKEAVVPLLDRLEGVAARVRAVNTTRLEGRRLVGYNTDVGGFLRSVRILLGAPPSGASVAILGAGGAGRAVAIALLDSGASQLHILNRSPGRAAALAAILQGSRGNARIDAHPLSGKAIGQILPTCDLLVNATPVGIDGMSCPLPAEWMLPGCAVMDLVYNPPTTPLVRAAWAVGARAQNGLGMLVYQAAEAFTLWTGLDAPLCAMFQAAEAALARSHSGVSTPAEEQKCVSAT